VIDHGNRLREAFENHENLAPDPAAVYAQVQKLALTYKRRRRGAQVAGGAVLSAGLIAGVINLPGMLPGGSPDTVSAGAPAAAPSSSTIPSPSVTPSASSEELARQWAAYFAAGYDYDDAVRLASLWGISGKERVGQAKAEAGRRLLAGETLPFPHVPGNPSAPSSTPAGGSGNTTETKRVAAFFGAGYDYNDAVKLADLWHTTDPYAAKIMGGKKLLAGETLPFAP